MKLPPKNQTICFYALSSVLFQLPNAVAAGTNNAATEQQIRKVVESMLQEKNQKIEQLEARIKQLESKQAPTQPAAQPQAPPPSGEPKTAVVESLEAPPGSGIGAVNAKKGDASKPTIMNKLGE